jgi:FkbM family methyltransferase
MRVFLDVGAHLGQTARAVLDHRYRFDRVVSFEPASGCWPHLGRVRDPRFAFCRFGLWRRTTDLPIFDPGTLGASIFKRAKHREGRRQVARFVRASEWFERNVSQDDLVAVKLNCEGAECDILEDLIDSSEIRKIGFLLVHFDVRKIPGLRHREREVRARLDQIEGLRYVVAQELRAGPTVRASVQTWLATAGLDQYSALSPLSRLRSRIATLIYVSLPRMGTVLSQRWLPHAISTRVRPAWKSLWRRF